MWRSKEPNEMEVLAILNALKIKSHSFIDRLILVSDSSNSISWASLLEGVHGSYNTYLRKSANQGVDMTTFLCYVNYCTSVLYDTLTPMLFLFFYTYIVFVLLASFVLFVYVLLLSV